MKLRKAPLRILVFGAVVLAGGFAWALRFQFSETKDQLKLKYDLEVRDYGNGCVGVDLTIADQGRIKPILSVDLVIPNHATKDGSGPPDLSVALATREVDGKLVAHAHVLKEWAERAQIHLNTGSIDGKTDALTGYYFVIPIRDSIKRGDVKRDQKPAVEPRGEGN